MANIKTFDLNLLRVLEALLDTRSVSRAADKLGVTQPAVSGMLARLRDALGDPLFIRTQRGVLPTPRAESLSGQVRKILGEVEQVLQVERFDPTQASLTLQIAATDYAQRAVLLPFLGLLREKAPGIRLAVRPVAPDFARQLAEGVLDLALVTPEMTPDTLRARKLFDECYVVIARADHPCRDRLNDLDVFCALDHAIMSHDGSAFTGPTDVALRQRGKRRNVVVSVPNFTILVDLIRRSELIALVPSRLVLEEPNILTAPPPLEVAGFRKILAWHERLQEDPSQKWVRDRLSDCVSAYHYREE